jgi:hypothetical protein
MTDTVLDWATRILLAFIVFGMPALGAILFANDWLRRER